ncbi:MAG: hypothetical protein J2P50_20750 [Hyphomicrobiaceae bacterium]|nr:hypothetical protein [Hyphomicrobiaceae bacterium]
MKTKHDYRLRHHNTNVVLMDGTTIVGQVLRADPKAMRAEFHRLVVRHEQLPLGFAAGVGYTRLAWIADELTEEAGR